MFKHNNQLPLITFEADLSDKQRKALNKTKEHYFNELIYKSINEADYKILYSEKYSRPNAPINTVVSALIYKEIKGISYDELMENMLFDLRTKKALGIANLDEVPFSRATLFNFQNRLSDYQQETDINLIEQTFNKLTNKQIKALSLKTNIQRTDSLMISTNIARLSRIRILIEVLLRLYRKMSSDKLLEEKMNTLLSDYIKRGSEKYIYNICSNDFPHELNKLGEIYYQINQLLNSVENNIESKEYRNFNRVYEEQFVIVENTASPKPNEQLHSGMLQSPDDEEATYNKKRGEENIGYKINATETASPDNPLQLIDDIAVVPNNITDNQILEERIETIKEKTPDIEELHTDGGYASKPNDIKMEELGITQVTTAIKGRQSVVELTIEQTSQTPETYLVSCPSQQADSQPTKQRFKVRFNRDQCALCPLKEKCQIHKNNGRYYFKRTDYLKNKRDKNIKQIPKERRKIRPNIEATMKEIRGKSNGGKLKVRGLFKTTMYAFTIGIGINFGRIFRHISDIEGNSLFNKLFSVFMQKLLAYIFLLTKIFDEKVRINKNFKLPICGLFEQLFSFKKNIRLSEGLNLGGF